MTATAECITHLREARGPHFLVTPPPWRCI
jgi:hypothetical protein